MNYSKLSTTATDIKLITFNKFNDRRGYFIELFNKSRFANGININFVQDNISLSKKNVIRGLHYQVCKPQAKLLYVAKGKIFDVIVDLRKKSKTFKKWYSYILSDKIQKQLWIPEGFAHGFLTLSKYAIIMYKTTEYRFEQYERSIKWDDPDLDINWPIKNEPIVSHKDKNAKYMKYSEFF